MKILSALMVRKSRAQTDNMVAIAAGIVCHYQSLVI